MQPLSLTARILSVFVQVQPAPTNQPHPGMSEPWLSVVGGGLVAAILTLAFNAWWDKKKAEQVEDWEWRRYKANLVHHSWVGLMDAFFSAKSELEFLSGTLDTLVSSLNLLTMKAEELIKQAGGQGLTVAELEERKNAALQPFNQYNAQQIQLRWNQHEQKANELQAKAEAILATVQPLVPADLFKDMMTLYNKLNTSWVWDLPNAKARLQMYRDVTPEFQDLQKRLAKHIEVQLGRGHKP
jgi:hypothetical protein